jgi:hypothetical protein
MHMEDFWFVLRHNPGIQSFCDTISMSKSVLRSIYSGSTACILPFTQNDWLIDYFLFLIWECQWSQAGRLSMPFHIWWSPYTNPNLEMSIRSNHRRVIDKMVKTEIRVLKRSLVFTRQSSEIRFDGKGCVSHRNREICDHEYKMIEGRRQRGSLREWKWRRESSPGIRERFLDLLPRQSSEEFDSMARWFCASTWETTNLRCWFMLSSSKFSMFEIEFSGEMIRNRDRMEPLKFLSKLFPKSTVNHFRWVTMLIPVRRWLTVTASLFLEEVLMNCPFGSQKEFHSIIHSHLTFFRNHFFITSLD